MTHNCPICKGETTKEVEEYVMKELAKLAQDPTYLPKIYDKNKLQEKTTSFGEKLV